MGTKFSITTRMGCFCAPYPWCGSKRDNSRAGVVRSLMKATLAVLILLLAPVASAQTGIISGKILDSSRGPLPYVSIAVKGTTRGGRTDSVGTYRVTGIPPGKYTVVARLIGFGTSQRTNVRVRKNKTTTVDFTLTLQAIKIRTTMEIVGRRPDPSERARAPLRTR